jgi:hypothetical protein
MSQLSRNSSLMKLVSIRYVMWTDIN